MQNKIEILLVEDTPSDVRLTQEALKYSPVEFELTIVTDGVEAIDYLNALKKSKDRKMPQLILLDLNMPKKNGHEVLEEIKADPELSAIPVVLLTVSERAEDVLEALRTKMNYYLAKPVTSERLCALVKAIHELHSEETQHSGTQSKEESHIRFVLAGNPHTPASALAKLAEDLNKKVRSKVAENLRISEDTQMQLARDPQADVRISLCENKMLIGPVLKILATDESHDVRLAVTSCPAVTLEILEQLSQDENVFVCDGAKKTMQALSSKS